MRLVHVSTLYPPELNTGGTLACHNLVKALQRRSHDVSVFTGRINAGDALDEEDFEFDGVQVHSIAVGAGYGPTVSNFHRPEVALRLRHYLRARKPEVVHFHSIQALGAEILQAARDEGARVVLTMHDFWFLCPQQFLVTPWPELRMCPPLVRAESYCDCIPGYDFAGRREYLERALESVDRVFAVSRYLARNLELNGLAQGKIEVCENGLNAPVRQARLRTRAVRFAYLGGPHPWKGLSTLVRALALVHGEFRIDLHWVHEGAWRQVGGIPDPRVRFLPAFEPGQVGRVLADADVALCPSIMLESFSLVVREAMQHGMPVISSESGGPQSLLVHGENGLLFGRGDPVGLARCMQRYIDDKAFLATTSAAAERSAASIRTIDAQAAQAESVYRGITMDENREEERALPPSVLFLTGIDGAPYRYRVEHLVEQLGLLGVSTTSRHYAHEDALQLAAEHEVVIFYRVPWGEYVEKVLARVRAAGALPVFSVDDLIFDVDVPAPALKILPPEEARAWLDGIRRYRKTLDACDAFLGTTTSLARAAEQTGKPVFSHPNTLSFQLIELSEKARREAQLERNTPYVRLAYFSGTRTHDRDFAAIAPALAEVMEARQNVQLVCAGHLTVPPELARFARRIERVPFVSWQKLPSVLATVDVNLAPLEADVLFCEAKSELKYFEAAIAGVVTIATPTEPFRRAITHGANGLLASTQAEWRAAMLSLVDDADLRGRLSRAALQHAYENYSPHVAAKQLKRTLASIYALRGERALVPLPPVTGDDIRALRAKGVLVGDPALEPQGAVDGPQQVAHLKPTPRMGGELVVSQPFSVGAGHFFRFDVFVGIYNQVARHDLRLRILDLQTSHEVVNVVRDAAEAYDNFWFAFEFEPIEGPRELCAVLDAPDAPAASGLSLWYAPDRAGRGRIGNARDLELTYRTFLHGPGFAKRAAIAVDGLTPEEALRKLAQFADREHRRAESVTRRLRALEDRYARLAANGPARPSGSLLDGVIERLAAYENTAPHKAARKVWRGIFKPLIGKK